MTKNELIFTIADAVRGQTATGDSGKFVHPQDLAFEIAMAYEKTVIDFFNMPEFAGNYDLDYFTKSFEQTVKEDSAKELYIDLPVQPIALSGAQGVRSLRPKDGNTQIVRMSESAWMDMRNLESWSCSPWPFCYIDFYNKRIKLQGNRPEYKLLDKIVLKVIPKFSELGDDDEINSPAGDYSLTGMVMNIMQLRPTDNTNDGGR